MLVLVKIFDQFLLDINYLIKYLPNYTYFKIILLGMYCIFFFCITLNHRIVCIT